MALQRILTPARKELVKKVGKIYFGTCAGLGATSGTFVALNDVSKEIGYRYGSFGTRCGYNTFAVSFGAAGGGLVGCTFGAILVPSLVISPFVTLFNWPSGNDGNSGCGSDSGSNPNSIHIDFKGGKFNLFGTTGTINDDGITINPSVTTSA